MHVTRGSERQGVAKQRTIVKGCCNRMQEGSLVDLLEQHGKEGTRLPLQEVLSIFLQVCIHTDSQKPQGSLCQIYAAMGKHVNFAASRSCHVA